MKEFVISKIGEEAAERFALWAFGEGYESLESIKLMRRWNRRHKNLLLLKGSNDAKADLVKMIEIWKKENP
jgi:hypothetical protein